MHAVAQGALIYVLPPFLYFLKADSLVLRAQLVNLQSTVWNQYKTALQPKDAGTTGQLAFM